MTLLVDTGASTVVLKPAEAERAGIDVGDLSYSVPVHTANGTAYAASVRLNSIAIGPLVLENVEALVAQPGSLNENLLGMSFLRRLRSYEFSKDFLTLRG
jgi:aspartyl protease family protein